MKVQLESSLTDAIECETFEATFMNFTNLQSPAKVRHATPIYVISLTFRKMLPSYRSTKLLPHKLPGNTKMALLD